METNIVLTPASLNELTMSMTEKLIIGLKDYLDKLLIQKQDVELMTTDEVCSLIGITRPTVIKYQERGLLIGYKVGTRLRFKKSEVEAALLKIKHPN